MISKIGNQRILTDVTDIISALKQLITTSHNENQQYQKLKRQSEKLSQSQKKQINEHLSNYQKERKKYLNILTENLLNVEQKASSLGTVFIIFLIATEIFYKIYKAFIDLQKQQAELLKKLDGDQLIQSKYKSISQIQNLFLTLMSNALRICPKIFDTFFYEQMKNIEQLRQKKFEDKEIKDKEMKDIDPDLEQIIGMLTQIYDEDRKSNQVINSVLEKIGKYQLTKKTEDLYRQIAINWIKYKLDEARREKQFLCCKSNFFYLQNFECFRKKLFCFKPFKFQMINNNLYAPPQKDKQRQKDQKKKITDQQEQLSKTIVALMNQKGGIIFLGVNEDEKKNLTVHGFQLDDKYKKEFLNYIKRIINQILPKHKGFEELDENNTSPYLGYIFELNYYITVQLVNITRKSTFESYRDQLKKKTYICKIIVKMGHPRHIYHILINEGNRQDKKQAQIQFYVRNQQGNEKQTIEKCYENLYKKWIDYSQIIKKSNLKVFQRPPLHQGCRYDMCMKAETFFLDVNDSSDQDG